MTGPTGPGLSSGRIYLREYNWGAYNYNNDTFTNPGLKFAGNPGDVLREWYGVPEDCFVDRATVQLYGPNSNLVTYTWTLWRATQADVIGSTVAAELAATSLAVVIQNASSDADRIFNEVTLETPLELNKGDYLAVKFTNDGPTNISGVAHEFKFLTWIPI